MFPRVARFHFLHLPSLCLASILAPALCAQGADRVAVPPPASCPTPTEASLPSATFRQDYNRIFLDDRHSLHFPAESHWLGEGEHYTVLETSPNKGRDGTRLVDLVSYDTGTGKRSVLVPGSRFIPVGSKTPLEVEDYKVSADKTKLLIYTNSHKVWRRNTRGDYWVLALGDGALRKLGGDAPEATLMFAKFSPDGHSVGYVHSNNLYVQDLGSFTIRQLTRDGSAAEIPDIINGTTDWVTEEELDLRDAFRWSPDSRSIAYLQFNQAAVGTYTLINDTVALYPVLHQYKYPIAGTTNSSVRAGVVSVAEGTTRWMELPGDPANHYIARFEWVGRGNELALEQLNREQNSNKVFLADGTTGAVRLLFEDTDAAWVEPMDALQWVAGSDNKPSDLLWLSERDGWKHAYLISRATGKLRLITHFDADVISAVQVDTRGGYFYFMASPGDPTQSYLYRSRLDGTGTPERVTPQNEPGTHEYGVAPGSHWAIHTWSNVTTPYATDLVELPSHTRARMLGSNEDILAYLKFLGASFPQLSRTPIGDGLALPTLLVTPPHFDPAKKYPVLVWVYGEPAATTVQDSWAMGSYFRLFADEGYIVASFDNQGTPAPLGRAWRKVGYKALDVEATRQQAAAIRALAREHAYIDLSRMAIWGASGGATNTLNLMFRDPGLYSTGIAEAPVPDQSRYDTIYQEKYMGTPQANPQGYHDGSAINFAAGLRGNLLLIHGSGDDNVHFQGSELLVDRLIELGKPFTFMDYPNRTHNLNEGPGTDAHLTTLIAHYLEEHVPPGPRPE